MYAEKRAVKLSSFDMRSPRTKARSNHQRHRVLSATLDILALSNLLKLSLFSPSIRLSQAYGDGVVG